MLIEGSIEENELQPLEEFIKLLQYIKTTKELLSSHEEKLKNLLESQSFKDSLKYLKELNPEVFEDLRNWMIGDEDVKRNSGF